MELETTAGGGGIKICANYLYSPLGFLANRTDHSFFNLFQTECTGRRLLKTLTIMKTETVNVLRSLYRELRPLTSSSGGGSVRKTQLWEFVVRQVRTATTAAEEEKTRNLTRTGELFIQSIRHTHEYLSICTAYKGKGERSPDEMASIMGFTMPNQPKQPRKAKPSS